MGASGLGTGPDPEPRRAFHFRAQGQGTAQTLPRPWAAQVSWHGHWDRGPKQGSRIQPAGGQDGGLPGTGLGDLPVHHSWIIGAAVVNAFYSPNRNQIGTFTLSVTDPSPQRPPPLPPGGLYHHPTCGASPLLWELWGHRPLSQRQQRMVGRAWICWAWPCASQLEGGGGGGGESEPCHVP